ncbi:unnamed protein product [Hyaloperonospora brassicae]|uniref:Uncharacterized protein n=1 Tax=Hyaloperonospora brassicae TaxID=162125 RepID=A0AAV0UQ14_HYABA|nr:unnamed protein product [Hyaloperonospora brassicae]
MLSMVSSTQSVDSAAASSKKDTSSSSPSVGMTAGASVAHVIASLAHSGRSSLQEADCHFYDTLRLHESLDESRDELDTLTETRDQQQQSVRAANKAAAVLTSVSRAGRFAAAASSAPKKRSTKSKCSPGLRSGKWTAEEESFTNLIIHFFKRGLLDVEDGTSLRWYLAKRLNCEAMRVTKKLKGNSSIGKQVFRAVENNPANRRAIRLAREELAIVESRFLESLDTGAIGTGTQRVSLAPLPSSLAVSVRGRKILPNTKHSDGLRRSVAACVPQPKCEDARLLIHFFSEAHDTNSDEEPEAEKRADSGGLSIDLGDKLGKKRPLPAEASVDAASEQCNISDDQDAESMKAKRQAIEPEEPTN